MALWRSALVPRLLVRSAALQLRGTASSTGGSIEVLGQQFAADGVTNVSPAIAAKLDRRLLHVPNHPLRIIKNHIEKFFSERGPYATFDNLDPIVTVKQNFDDLLVPSDHVSRSPSDNYYINSEYLLRAHTSAHQSEIIPKADQFLIAGDVYRRDEIDRSHYPVFHQMEGVHLWNKAELHKQAGVDLPEEGTNPRTEETQKPYAQTATVFVGDHLKKTLQDLALHLFGPETQCRWVPAYFPFTHPSWELEVFFEGDWLEVLGCGVVEHQILQQAGADHKMGWAFGLGLERLAMVLFQIPDIRLFWSQDERFISQFDESKHPSEMKFKEFSKFPPCCKDISFWIPPGFSSNSFSDIVRGVAGDLVENVALIDDFTHPKTKRQSHCYQITYRSMDRNVTNEEINDIQSQLRETVAEKLNVELR
eukprot:m.12884 g.12884  ORF g.12884 m.12884 type:complete len:421 (-) comp3266_c0_seq1:779-2041(-)